jgi:hypothetical protein
MTLMSHIISSFTVGAWIREFFKINIILVLQKNLWVADFNLKRNKNNPFDTKWLATRKIVRGPRLPNCPPAAPICQSAQTIFLSIFRKTQEFYPLQGLRFRLNFSGK